MSLVLRCSAIPEATAVPYLLFYNDEQNVWHKVKKFSKIGQDFKS